MKKQSCLPFLLYLIIAYTSTAFAASTDFNFGVVANSFGTNSGEQLLRAAIKDSDADNLAFVVVNGIKSDTEPCNDSLYTRRRALLDSAQNGLILSLAASDWSNCKNSSDNFSTVERLNRIRELFFAD